MNDRPLKIGTKVPTAIYTASDEPVCIVDSMKERTDDAQVARRLVACWNACLGISTEALEAMPGHFFGAIAVQRGMMTWRHRDELLAALEKCRKQLSEWMRDHGEDIATKETIREASAQIDSLKGTP